jgi:hypothetical protein
MVIGINIDPSATFCFTHDATRYHRGWFIASWDVIAAIGDGARVVA